MPTAYKLTRAGNTFFLETSDDMGVARAFLISGNVALPILQVSKGENDVIVAQGSGEWSEGPGLVEFRAPSWKLRIEGDRATVRTGDGEVIPHLFSGIGVGRTGESAVARLAAFFRFEPGGGC